MPRQGRIQSGTGVYHVMLRGINRQQIFESEEDNTHMLYVLSNLHLQYSPDGKPLADDCACIDIDEADILPKLVHTDESVRSALLRLSQCQTLAEFQRKDIAERKQVCRQLKELGAGVRQLSRLTGISLGTISKC